MYSDRNSMSDWFRYSMRVFVYAYILDQREMYVLPESDIKIHFNILVA